MLKLLSIQNIGDVRSQDLALVRLSKNNEDIEVFVVGNCYSTTTATIHLLNDFKLSLYIGDICGGARANYLFCICFVGILI